MGANTDAVSRRFLITMLHYGAGVSDPLNGKDAKIWYKSLCYGIAGHQHALVKLLLQEGAKVETECMSNPYVKHPLWLAIEQEDTEMIKILVQGGAPVDGRSFQGDTQLHYAVRRSSETCVLELLKLGAHVDAVNCENENALVLAIVDDKAKLVALLVKNGADPKSLLHLLRSNV
jgi:ankyrin repeat protein